MKIPFDCAETALIGGMMKSPEQLVDCIKFVRANDFSNPERAVIWQLIVEAAAAKIDLEPTALYIHLISKQNDHPNAVTDEGNLKIFEIIQTAFLEAPLTTNLTFFAKEIRKASIARKTASLSAEIAGRAAVGLESPDQLSELDSLRLEHANLFDDAVTTFDKALELFEGALAQKEGTLMKTGFKDVDRVIGAFSPGDLCYIAARPGMGKTAFMLNLLVNFSKADKQCAVLSLEMPTDQLVGRLATMHSGVNLRKVTSNTATEDELDRFMGAMKATFKTLARSQFANTELNPTQLEAEVKALASQKKVDVVFVDYLQLMDSGGDYQSREQEVSAMSKAMKRIAKRYQVTMICLAQLNRAVEHRQDKRPTLADLRDSGGLEQDADQILLLKRPKYYDAEADDTLEISVAKNRHGSTGDITLAADMARGVFSDLSHLKEW